MVISNVVPKEWLAKVTVTAHSYFLLLSNVVGSDRHLDPLQKHRAA